MDKEKIIKKAEFEIMQLVGEAGNCGPLEAREYLTRADTINALLTVYKRYYKPPLMKIVIPGNPATKKNNQRILKRKNGTRFVAPSQRFEDYQEMAGYYIPKKLRQKINRPVIVRGLYYREKRYRVDLVNLLEATCDILVHYGVLEDDNCTIVRNHDGSGVRYDKVNPRAEIEIVEAAP